MYSSLASCFHFDHLQKFLTLSSHLQIRKSSKVKRTKLCIKFANRGARNGGNVGLF